MSRQIVVSLHDVSPSTFGESRQWLRMVERHGLVATLLVVPGHWRGAAAGDSEEFVEWLNDATTRGHEVSMHGWEHRAVSTSTNRSAHRSSVHRLVGRLLARGCEEFWMLGYDEAFRRLRFGLDALESCGLRVRGFTPPGWLASPETRAALRDLGFVYTTSHGKVRDLGTRRSIRMFALSQRPGSSATAGAAWVNERIAAFCVRRDWSFRLALHPDDLRHAVIVTSVNRTMAMVRRCAVRSLTYEALIGEARHERVGAAQWSIS